VISKEQYRDLLEVRARNRGAIAEAARWRKRPEVIDDGRGLFLVSGDHLARGVVRSGGRNDRHDLLNRLVYCLEHPAVDGFIGTPDLVEDLLLLNALDGKVVLGSMNRSGLAGSVWEMDDRFNCYDVRGIGDARLEGGKMLLRIDMGDPGSNSTIESCAVAVRRLARADLMALVEPLAAVRHSGRWMVSSEVEAMTRVVAVASSLGSTSSHTWLRLPPVDELETVASVTSLPILLLAGDPGQDPDRVYDRWRKALQMPQVRGLIAGQALLYPPNDNLDESINVAAGLMQRPIR
jgi:hypothetical protein